MASFGKLIRVSGKRKKSKKSPVPNQLMVVTTDNETCFKIMGQNDSCTEKPENKEDTETFKSFPNNKFNII